MSDLLRLFFSITLFKKGPQDVPYSWFLFAATLVITFILDLLVLNYLNTRKEPISTFVILRYLVIGNVASIVMVYLIFVTHRYKNRFLQSITAMFGTELVLSIISVPIILLRIIAFKSENVTLAIFGFLLTMFLIGWNIIVNMHILRFGLSVSPFYAGALSLILFAMGIFIFDLFIPVEAA